MFNESQGKMKKILEKSGKSQGISSEEKSGNPAVDTIDYPMPGSGLSLAPIVTWRGVLKLLFYIWRKSSNFIG